MQQSYIHTQWYGRFVDLYKILYVNYYQPIKGSKQQKQKFISRFTEQKKYTNFDCDIGHCVYA